MTDLPTEASFASLGLSAALIQATDALGYGAPTPVQRETIPSALRGGDLFVGAPTGSGKTAAFALPLLSLLSEDERPRGATSALVLAPTRELADQIGGCLRDCGRYLSRRPAICVAFGGVSINPQMMAMRGGADVFVATPGRLLDLVDKNAVSFDQLRVLVLDEADRLLDRGFRDELDRIFARLPTERRTWLFSATLADAVEDLGRAALREPTRVHVASEGADAPRITQRVIEVDKPRRTQLLRRLIETASEPRVLVFVATTYATEHVARKLRDVGISAAAMHGKLSQGARRSELARLASGDIAVLIATDVAARGLDVDGVSMIVNYDLPRSTAEYLHRIGRTARAGASGVAISFVTEESRAHFRLIERRHGLVLPREQLPGFEPVAREVIMVVGEETGGIKGHRKSKKDRLREAAARRTAEGVESVDESRVERSDEPG